ncbi:hypothetical protein D3C72_971420 [compost metagenome]
MRLGRGLTGQAQKYGIGLRAGVQRIAPELGRDPVQTGQDGLAQIALIPMPASVGERVEGGDGVDPFRLGNETPQPVIGRQHPPHLVSLILSEQPVDDPRMVEDLRRRDAAGPDPPHQQVTQQGGVLAPAVHAILKPGQGDVDPLAVERGVEMLDDLEAGGDDIVPTPRRRRDMAAEFHQQGGRARQAVDIVVGRQHGEGVRQRGVLAPIQDGGARIFGLCREDDDRLER